MTYGTRPFKPLTPEQELLQYRDMLRSMGGGDRRNYYTTPEFKDALGKVSGIVNTLFGKERAQHLIEFAVEMRTAAQQMPPEQLSAINMITRASWRIGGGADATDSFFTYFDAIANEVVTRDNSELAKNLLQQIDANYVEPTETLIESIPDELEKSKELLEKALQSMNAGRKEECVLFTRMAWESAINYALSRLPKVRGLESLSKKSQYVLEQMMKKDASRTITQAKNMMDTLFLHELDTEKVVMPEVQLPFFISLTTAVVRSIGLMLT